MKAYTVKSTRITYSGIRTFYKPHAHASKIPEEPDAVPMLVFIHGLGGSAAQFERILRSLTNLGPCLSIDLPGCGRSKFEPKSWEAYTTDALVGLLAEVIHKHRDQNHGQRVILIGHSMGCSLAILLASSSSPRANLISEHVAGVIAICPQAEPLSEKQSRALKLATKIPTLLFDLLRKWDRVGGTKSRSVLRMAGSEAEEETKYLQLLYNRQSRSPVWQRMARGMIPDNSKSSPYKGGLPGREVWQGLTIPVFLTAGEADTMTPPENLRKIVEFLGRDADAISSPIGNSGLPIVAAPVYPATNDSGLGEPKHQDSGIDASDLPQLDDDVTQTVPSASSSPAGSLANTDDSITVESATLADMALSTSATSATKPTSDLPPPLPRRLVVKATILPKPASHALLFAPSCSRTLAGLIQTFLADHVDGRLSMAWQLQYLTTEGKWEVKNLEKWKDVQPVSLPIANTFRAMKTLREADDQHTPKVFVKEWGGKIRAVVDISHDSPVYHPDGLEHGGITYHKFPSVSKLPPSVDEVREFINLIDEIRGSKKAGPQGLIGVHCHYGFNRTGFFVVSYLVERLGYRVQDAVDEFAKARPPGIRHDHFINEIHVRYTPGLKKAPTL
ncbi:hypothetical protein CC78DRAFT_290697 [Lojkania enalia]|uniref:Tyrosine specific protein phosphatases domain-containing protein n=1 Tax=Lojkania enalia TaxID=147567 RepID=A0A9P4N7V2_9PLEO|nr:hypothetical protein CC78DRAFT_290697 [Didymosphaeria enalia]